MQLKQLYSAWLTFHIGINIFYNTSQKKANSVYLVYNKRIIFCTTPCPTTILCNHDELFGYVPLKSSYLTSTGFFLHKSITNMLVIKSFDESKFTIDAEQYYDAAIGQCMIGL
ncbi:MAG: hypothetical protein AAF770_02405 [Bacteroidota bacterium]